MQGAFDFGGALSGLGPGKDPLADLDNLDVDGLLSYFNQPAAQGMGLGDPANLMAHQVPFRTAGGAYGGQQQPVLASANLFSSILLPEPSTMLESGLRGGDSDDSSGEQDGGGPRRKGDKSQAIQEKNRRAQKRFRERQKAKMKDMTEQLEEMGSELSKLRVDNGALKNRNSILEKVLALRDEHIRVLQDEQQVFDLGNHYLQAAQQQKLITSGGPPAPVSALTTVEINAVKTMPADVVINRWKDTVRELGNILIQIEGCPDASAALHQEAMDALCRVLDQAGQLCMYTAVLHPTNMQKLIACTLDDGRSGVRADDRERWSSVTASLQLTQDQKSQTVSLRQIFLRRMSKVMEARRTILSKLQMVNIPDRMLALQSVISETLKVNECTSELKANLQEEHLAGMEFIGTVFKTIFSPLQKARAIVQSYPFYPDVYQIATVLASEKEGAALVESLDVALAEPRAAAEHALPALPPARRR